MADWKVTIVFDYSSEDEIDDDELHDMIRDSFDLVLVPGLAFTAEGERLGRGGGFYDRLLSSPGFRAFKVGVCFDRQMRETLPMEPHDQRVHRVVTEKGFLQRPDLLKQGKPAA